MPLHLFIDLQRFLPNESYSTITIGKLVKCVRMLNAVVGLVVRLTKKQFGCCCSRHGAAAPAAASSLGPCEVPATWKDKDYDDIPIVQDARPADHCVEAYLQGTSDIPTFRVVWITSMGTIPKLVSPNRSRSGSNLSQVSASNLKSQVPLLRDRTENSGRAVPTHVIEHCQLSDSLSSRDAQVLRATCRTSQAINCSTDQILLMTAWAGLKGPQALSDSVDHGRRHRKNSQKLSMSLFGQHREGIPSSTPPPKNSLPPFLMRLRREAGLGLITCSRSWLFPSCSIASS